MGNFEKENFNCFDNKISKLDKNIIGCDLKIGLFLSDYSPIIITIISSLGFLSNFIMIIYFFFKSRKSTEKSTKNTMKKLFTVLQVLDCIQSLYWIISSLLFKTAKDIKNKANICSSLSLTYIFVINFEFILMNFLLNNFKRISSNPIHGIFKPYKNIFKYIFISFCLGLVMTLFATYGGSVGRSPLITCFLNTEDNFAVNIIILSLPIILAFFIIYQILYDLYKNELFVSDKNVRKLYKKNVWYVLISTLLYLPMIILMILSLFKYLDNDKTKYYYKEINNIIIILTCSIPLIINFIRILQGFTELRCSKKILEKNVITNLQRAKTYRNTLNKSLNENLSLEEQYAWLEKHSIEYFIRDIFIGISTALDKSTRKYRNIDQVIPSYTHESKKYRIHFGNFDLDDETVEKSDYLDIKIEEFAPKCFAYLRNLENIDMVDMVKQFLPKNNKKGISESQGKSGSFFISTDDNKYMIKTLKVEEFDLIKNSFLYKYCKYLKENPKSLLSRLYGMYNLNVNQGKDIIQNQMIASEKVLVDDNEEEKNNTVNDNIENMKRNYSVMGEGKFHDIEYFKPYLYPSINQGNAYILSIIDYLQLFNFFKYLEMELKTKFKKDGKKIISCVDPKTYSDRFINYIIGVTEMEDIFKVDEEPKQIDNINFNTGEVSVSNIEINTDSNLNLEVGELSSKNDLINQ